MDLKRVVPRTIASCTACKRNEYLPQPEDVPEQFRRLKPRVLEAFRPLDIDAGKYERAQNGYRIHSSMMTFVWAPRSVEDKIDALTKRKDRKADRKAVECLLELEDCAYKDFLKRHDRFLERMGDDAEEKERKQPLGFIEEPGLECALWSHLYWKSLLCETVVRADHEAREKRKRQEQQRRDIEDTSGSASDSGSSGRPRRKRPRKNESSSADTETSQDTSSEEDPEGEGASDDEGEGALASTKHRIKRSFLKKVFSPVIEYGGDYELLHFVYDLSMWTTVGTKKNIASQYGVPTAVIDMQRQCGNATLFRTRAPYEKKIPFLQWILDEQQKLARSRLHLAGTETLHVAHVLFEIDRGYFHGSKNTTGRADRTWKNHMLGPREPNGPPTVKNSATRVEFQDGKRKEATQRYYGRGTVHDHSLDFLDNVEAIHRNRKCRRRFPRRSPINICAAWCWTGSVMGNRLPCRGVTGPQCGTVILARSCYSARRKTSQSVTKMFCKRTAMGMSSATRRPTSRNSAAHLRRTG